MARDVTVLTYKDGVLYDDGEPIYRGRIDSLSGGFPCQDISVAGKQEGIGEGTRSGLWSECARLLGEIRPDYAIFENVTALLSGESGRWFQRVLWDISEIGYDAEWHCIPAGNSLPPSPGAPHQRDRVWIVAYSNSAASGNERQEVVRKNELMGGREAELNNDGDSEYVAHTPSIRQPGQGQLEQSLFAKTYAERQAVDALAGSLNGEWAVEPELGRVANGIPDRSHRLKCLGNAVVPQIPEIIGKAIMGTT